MKTEDDHEASIGTRERLLVPERETDERPIYTRSRRRTAFQLFRSWFGSFSLGVVAALLAVWLWQSLQPRAPSYTFAKTDALPDIPWDTVLFASDEKYQQRPNDDSDFAWNSLLPPGRGYVFVDDSEERGLLAGEVTDYGEIYSVSMFHQLHCLARLRNMHFTFLDAVATGEMTIARIFAGRDAAQHVQHCLDYLRQSIICAGDMTLEWPKQDGVASKARVDGWDIPHKCKNRAAIDAFMDKFHFNGSAVFDAAG